MGRIEPKDIVVGEHTPVEWEWLPEIVVDRLRLEREKERLSVEKNPRFATQWFKLKERQLAKQNVNNAARIILTKK